MTSAHHTAAALIAEIADLRAKNAKLRRVVAAAREVGMSWGGWADVNNLRKALAELDAGST